jgi:hypothetical protein
MTGRMGEWENGRMREWENERMTEVSSCDKLRTKF